MAYCKKCGAYIPDGLSACLACGFDEAAEQARENEQAAAAQAFQRKSEEENRRAEELRAKAEARRREQQEMNRKWAESEQRRRQMQEEFRRSQEEAAARAAEQEAQRRTLNEDGYARLHRSDSYSERSSADMSADRLRILSCLSYISFLCFLPSILGVSDPFTKFHAKQGRKLFFSALVLSWIPGVNGLVWLFQIALAVIGIRNANSGRMEELPVVGHLGESR